MGDPFSDPFSRNLRADCGDCAVIPRRCNLIYAPNAENSGSILRSERAAHPGVHPRMLRLGGGGDGQANPGLAPDKVTDSEIVP
jgi:hypothetical protein